MKFFVYNKKQDSCKHSAGKVLKTNGSVYNEGNHKVKYYKTNAFEGFKLRDQWTQNKNGSFIDCSLSRSSR
jgi:hypothetical protein